jgi:NADPH:quinone reductase-like Zn-dependent oxidoreductase
MIALRFESFGSIPDVLKATAIDAPKPRRGEVLVRVAAAAINPSDAKNVLGLMRGTSLPRTPGRDFAGVVVETPDSELPVGREIWGSGGDLGFERDGAHAEFLVVPSEGVAPKPASLTMTEAAAVGTAFLTAYLGLVKVASVRESEWVVVTGANRAVGSSVLQLAQWRRAHTISVERARTHTRPRAAIAADAWIDSSNEDLPERVREVTKGHGADVAFDCVGGPLFEPCLKSLGDFGRQVNITSVGERRVSFDLLDFYHHRLTLFGVDSRALTSVECARILRALSEGFDSGALRPPRVAMTVGIADAVDAYVRVAEGSAGGKVVLSFA